MQKNIHDLLYLISEFEKPPNVVIYVTKIRLKFSTSLKIHLLNYNFVDENTKSNAVGVRIYVIDDWNFTINGDFHFDCVSFENLWINLFANCRDKYIIGVICRHFHNNGIMFLEKLEETLYANNQVSTKCCLSDDINISLLKTQDPLTIDYTNILHRKYVYTSYQQTYSTRITKTSSTIIDHMLINNCNVSIMNGTLNFEITDHLPVFILKKKVKHSCHKGLEKMIYLRNMREVDKTLFLTELENNLNSYFNIPADRNQLDLILTYFISDLKATIDKPAPLRNISRKKENF